MRKKNIFLILFFILTINLLFAFDYNYQKLNYSATNYAFGLYSGGSNIWNKNPLDIWSNPAKLGYYNGISFGYSNYDWLKSNTYKYAYLTIADKGMGLAFPIIGSDFGKITNMDQNGNIVDEYDNKIKTYAIGINFFQLTNNVFSNGNFESISKRVDLSIGYSYLDLPDKSFGKDAKDIYTDNLGIILRYSPVRFDTKKNMINMDFVSSYNWLNFTKTKFKMNDETEQIVYKKLISGRQFEIASKFAISSYLLKNILPDNFYKFSSNFINNALSFYANYNYSVMDGEKSNAKGMELTLCDIISGRYGYFSGKEIKGTTMGLGLNLSYKKYFKIQYNISSIPLANERQTVNDWMINIDFLRIFGLDK